MTEESLNHLLSGKTIEKIELRSWQSPNDTLYLFFTDTTSIKIMSDPNLCFDGLAFYVKKYIEVKKVVEDYEELK